jgi:hypothetical protein
LLSGALPMLDRELDFAAVLFLRLFGGFIGGGCFTARGWNGLIFSVGAVLNWAGSMGAAWTAGTFFHTV